MSYLLSTFCWSHYDLCNIGYIIFSCSFLTDSLVKDGDGPTSTHSKSVLNDLGLLRSSKDPLNFQCGRFIISLRKIFATSKITVKSSGLLEWSTTNFLLSWLLWILSGFLLHGGLENTVKPLNSRHLQVLNNLSVIERCPLLGCSLSKIVTFGTKYFVYYSRHARYLGCPL